MATYNKNIFNSKKTHIIQHPNSISNNNLMEYISAFYDEYFYLITADTNNYNHN